jgi:hypothetical protein
VWQLGPVWDQIPAWGDAEGLQIASSPRRVSSCKWSSSTGWSRRSCTWNWQLPSAASATLVSPALGPKTAGLLDEQVFGFEFDWAPFLFPAPPLAEAFAAVLSDVDDMVAYDPHRVQQRDTECIGLRH